MHRSPPSHLHWNLIPFMLQCSAQQYKLDIPPWCRARMCHHNKCQFSWFGLNSNQFKLVHQTRLTKPKINLTLVPPCTRGMLIHDKYHLVFLCSHRHYSHHRALLKWLHMLFLSLGGNYQVIAHIDMKLKWVYSVVYHGKIGFSLWFSVLSKHFIFWQKLLMHSFLSVPPFLWLREWTVSLMLEPQRYESSSSSSFPKIQKLSLWRRFVHRL